MVTNYKYFFLNFETKNFLASVALRCMVSPMRKRSLLCLHRNKKTGGHQKPDVIGNSWNNKKLGRFIARSFFHQYDQFSMLNSMFPCLVSPILILLPYFRIQNKGKLVIFIFAFSTTVVVSEQNFLDTNYNATMFTFIQLCLSFDGLEQWFLTGEVSG